MATGTGLPIPKTQDVLTQPTPVVNTDAYVSAQAWRQIAATGAALGKDAADLARLEIHQRQTGYLAENEIEIDRKRTELRDQFASDPQGFEAAWKGYTDGKMTNAERWAIPHLKRQMASAGNGAHGAILGERRANDQRLDGERLTTLAGQASSDYVSSAMAGVPDPAKLDKFRSVVASAVTSRLMTPEKAELLIDETAGRAQGEVAARDGVSVYREHGYESAVEHLRKNVLENEGLQLKPAEKRRAFTRGLEAINLQRRVDKEDKAGIIEESKDTLARLKSNQQVEIGTVQEQLGALKRVGAWSAYRDLYVETQVNELTGPYRSGGQRPADFARVVGQARSRAVLDGPRVQTAMKKITDAGYSPVAAAGIVGNLLQESADMNPAQTHDQGTGLGIAGWRLERRTALQNFAKARSKDATDFDTQVDFLLHELNTSEAPVGDALRRARTPDEAAEAFIHFERPAGYSQANPRGGHGFANRVANARQVAGVMNDAGGMPYGGMIVKRAQEEFSRQMRKEWPDFKKQIDAGKDISAEDFDAVRMGAAVSGDATWIKDVEDAFTAKALGKVVAAAPVGQGQAAVDEIKQKFNETVAKSVEAQFQRRVKLVTESPTDYAIENGRQPPRPLDFSSPQSAQAGISERVNIARAVAEENGIAPGNPFRAAETAALAGTIATGKVEQASAALGAIGSLPDDMLVPALKNGDIRSAITGSLRSGDAARFNATMAFADKLWQRAPDTAKELLGEENLHQLMTWQSNLRYANPEKFDQYLEEQRGAAAADPQVRKRREANESEGRVLARKMDTNDIVKQFDTSWGITPGPIARATGSQALAPVDAGTRDALMGDYETVFARRFAETRDADVAAKQTVEILKTKWARSEVNNGRLMLRPPETVYPAIDGSHAWMRRQLEADLAKVTGSTGDDPTGGSPLTKDYTIVADRRTDAEAQAGRQVATGGDMQPFQTTQGPSYLVVTFDPKTGRSDVVRREDGTPLRYSWDIGPDRDKARVNFEAERARVLNRPPGVARNMPGIN